MMVLYSVYAIAQIKPFKKYSQAHGLDIKILSIENYISITINNFYLS